jgi:F0F1-type ATP synthase assembly protein I
MGTAPFGTLCLMIGGIFVGTLGVYRTVRQANQVIANQDRRSDNGGRE